MIPRPNRRSLAPLVLVAAALAGCVAPGPDEEPDDSAEAITTIIKPGSLSGATKLSVPSKISGLRSDPAVIAGYLDVTHYGADPTGVKDSTAAFQNAINDAGSNASGSIGASMVVYVP